LHFISTLFQRQLFALNYQVRANSSLFNTIFPLPKYVGLGISMRPGNEPLRQGYVKTSMKVVLTWEFRLGILPGISSVKTTWISGNLIAWESRACRSLSITLVLPFQDLAAKAERARDGHGAKRTTPCRSNDALPGGILGGMRSFIFPHGFVPGTILASSCRPTRFFVCFCGNPSFST
jgi:hypothetical protein